MKIYLTIEFSSQQIANIIVDKMVAYHIVILRSKILLFGRCKMVTITFDFFCKTLCGIIFSAINMLNGTYI